VTRRQFVLRLVLNEITDDYEEPVHIHDLIVKHSQGCGVHISAQASLGGYCWLVEDAPNPPAAQPLQMPKPLPLD
jgi:hypothetical protein